MAHIQHLIGVRCFDALLRKDHVVPLLGDAGAAWVGVHRLAHCYRIAREGQDGGYGLYDALADVRGGTLPPAQVSLGVEVHVLEGDAHIDTYVRDALSKHDAGQLPVCIAWQNKDVARINRWVQALLLRAGHLDAANRWTVSSATGAQHFYPGDRVVYNSSGEQGSVDKTTGVTNATMGTIQSVVPSRNCAVVRWEDGTITPNVAASSPLARDLCLAYCLTVHKAQGSEYERVLVACYEADKMARCGLDRRWLYTAMSRAKSWVCVACTPEMRGFVARSVPPPPLLRLDHRA